MSEAELEHRLTDIENRSKSNTKRLDEHDEKIANITDLVVSVKELALEVKHMREDLNETVQRVSRLENRENEKWEKFKWLIVAGLVTVALSCFAVTLGIK